MPVSHEAVLRCLFAIADDELSNDLRDAESDVAALHDEIQRLSTLPDSERTAESEARIEHLRLIEASVLSGMEGVPPEMKTFHASVAAGAVAHHAEQTQTENPECSKLLRRMDEIRAREGLGEDEFWERDEDAPADYQDLSAEFSRRTAGNERIHETVFEYILRRYKLIEIATLFENEREEFDMQREIGVRVTWGVNPQADVARLLDEANLKRFGAENYERIKARAAAILAERKGS